MIIDKVPKMGHSVNKGHARGLTFIRRRPCPKDLIERKALQEILHYTIMDPINNSRPIIELFFLVFFRQLCIIRHPPLTLHFFCCWALCVR